MTETAEPMVEEITNPEPHRRFSGIFYAIIAIIVFTSSVFLTKQLEVELLDAIILRFFLQTLFLFIYIKCIKNYTFYEHPNKKEIFFLFINLIAGTTGYLSFFVAYRYLPLADLITIRYSQVIWTVIFTGIIYREKPSILIICAIILTMTGVILVVQPQFLFVERSTRFIGIFIALYCSIALSVTVISNKHLLLNYQTKHSLIMFSIYFFNINSSINSCCLSIC